MAVAFVVVAVVWEAECCTDTVHLRSLGTSWEG